MRNLFLLTLLIMVVLISCNNSPKESQFSDSEKKQVTGYAEGNEGLKARLMQEVAFVLKKYRYSNNEPVDFDKFIRHCYYDDLNVELQNKIIELCMREVPEADIEIAVIVEDLEHQNILAWVPNKSGDFSKDNYSQIKFFAGTAIYPMIYLTAIAEQGVSPCYEVEERTRTIVANSNEFHNNYDYSSVDVDYYKTYEILRLKEALKIKSNHVATFLVSQLGSLEPIMDWLNYFYIEGLSETQYKNMELTDVVRGEIKCSLEDLVNYYSIFPNNGYFKEASFLKSIKDEAGNEMIMENHIAQTLHEEPNYVLIEMLKYCISDESMISKIPTEKAGYEGVTFQKTHGWYVGFTPSVIVGVWVGETIYNNNTQKIDYTERAKKVFAEVLAELYLNNYLNFNKQNFDKIDNNEHSIGLDCDEYEYRKDDDLDEDDGNYYEDPFGASSKHRQ